MYITPPKPGMAEADPCEDLHWIDKLLGWWGESEADICQTLGMVKKYRDLGRQIKDYRRRACNLKTVMRHTAQIINSIDELRRIGHKMTHGLEPTQDDFCRRWADAERELDLLATRAGFVTQARITRWLHEGGFKITDIEVEHDGGKHSFDIEIEDGAGCVYDIEVWQDTGLLAHREQRNRMRILAKGNRILCEDQGAWDKGAEHVSKHGGIDNDAEANLATLLEKVEQLREDSVGVVMACIRPELPIHPTLIPQAWGRRLPEDKCVIVLRFGDGGRTKERRGVGYLVCSPGFGHVEAARKIIESLRFEYVEDDAVPGINYDVGTLYDPEPGGDLKRRWLPQNG